MPATHDQPLRQLPLVPEPILRRYRVFEPSDTRFRACARLLQALWREQHQLPIGTHASPDGTRRKLGSRLSPAAGRSGANFLTPAVAALTRREVAYREVGALIREDRLWTNLLSSAPLTFNLFGPLRLDLALASRVLRLLCPDPSRAPLSGRSGSSTRRVGVRPVTPATTRPLTCCWATTRPRARPASSRSRSNTPSLPRSPPRS
jgi:hypothetical protein